MLTLGRYAFFAFGYVCITVRHTHYTRTVHSRTNLCVSRHTVFLSDGVGARLSLCPPLCLRLLHLLPLHRVPTLVPLHAVRV